jgi:hypothetical protein
MSWIKDFFGKNFKFYAAYLLIILFLIFLIFEILIRSMTFSTGAGIGSASERWNNRYWKPINELGYRDFDILVNDKRKSVIFLGDSFTAGQGVKFDQTFYYLISKSLDKHLKTINLGQSGTSTNDQIENLSQLNDQINPKIDTLVIQYFGNDIEDYAQIKPVNKNIFRRFFSKLSELYSFFDSLYIAKKWNQDYMDSLFLSYKNQNKMNLHLEEINRLFSIARKKDSRIIFLTFPFLNNNSNLEKSKIYISQLKDNFKEICKKGDFFVDISHIARKFKTNERVVNFLDAHPSPELHSETALILLSILNNKKRGIEEIALECKK